ncbi:alkaline phosphatase family protein [Haloarcula laminariae]|uniref:hypothetical protein n=1 Tax=Haloarcula laminariae TaxID=2961577 RepID=UPI00240640B3|nr:hypothetical protein [Halomicroarcula sp. FL173]
MVYQKALQALSTFQSDGELIYERDWDVLIVLDGCRLDLMREVAPEFGLSPVDSMVSANTMTKEWMRANFTSDFADEMANTIYVCSNPYSDTELSQGDFETLDEVWRDQWDDEAGTILPKSVTDRAIVHGRQRETERLIVHYMQPHYPFLGDNSNGPADLDTEIIIDQIDTTDSSSVWDQLRRGKVSQEDVWEGYGNNLRVVLESVNVLLNNVDSNNIVITSDHGNALGEWGIYGHPMNMPLNSLREVPWIRTESSDSESYQPNIQTEKDTPTESPQDRLSALGYVE